MSNQITYDDKVDLNVATEIANINKVTAADMNEIKQVVNAIDTETSTDITSILQAINNPTYTTTEGSDLSIENTRVGKMKFEYYGDTEQETTTGKNKIGPLTDFVANDTSAINVTYNTEANTITVKHLTTAAWKGIYKTLTGLTAGATMTISVYATTTTSTGWSLSVRNSGGTVIDETTHNTSGTETHFTFTVPNDGSITIRAYAGYGDVAVNDTATYSKFQLEYGSSVTAYEPYTGGIASPNPSYLQEVKTVTGLNTMTIENEDETQSQNYEINLGKNLWKNTTLQVAERNTTTGELATASVWVINTEPQDVQSNTTYTVSQKETPCQYRILYFNDTTYLSYEQNNINLTNGYKHTTFTTPNNCNKVYVQFRSTLEVIASTGGYSMNVNAITNVQLEKGSTATTYVSYFTPIDLCKIGNYQDYIYNNGGKWFKHKEVGKIIDSSGSTGITISEMVNNGSIFSYCGGSVNAKTITYASAITTTNYIYYQLATTTEEEITEPILINELNAIKYGAESYYDTTNIMITSAGLKLILKAQTLDKIGD